MTGEMPDVEICHLPMTGQTVITIRLPDELFQAARGGESMIRCEKCSYWSGFCSCPAAGVFKDGKMLVFSPKPEDPDACRFFTTSKDLPPPLTLEDLEGWKP